MNRPTARDQAADYVWERLPERDATADYWAEWTMDRFWEWCARTNHAVVDVSDQAIEQAITAGESAVMHSADFRGRGGVFLRAALSVLAKEGTE